jgi:hypothetical protein
MPSCRTALRRARKESSCCRLFCRNRLRQRRSGRAWQCSLACRPICKTAHRRRVGGNLDWSGRFSASSTMLDSVKKEEDELNGSSRLSALALSFRMRNRNRTAALLLHERSHTSQSESRAQKSRNTNTSTCRSAISAFSGLRPCGASTTSLANRRPIGRAYVLRR